MQSETYDGEFIVELMATKCLSNNAYWLFLSEGTGNQLKTVLLHPDLNHLIEGSDPMLNGTIRITDYSILDKILGDRNVRVLKINEMEIIERITTIQTNQESMDIVGPTTDDVQNSSSLFNTRVQSSPFAHQNADICNKWIVTIYINKWQKRTKFYLTAHT